TRVVRGTQRDRVDEVDRLHTRPQGGLDLRPIPDQVLGHEIDAVLGPPLHPRRSVPCLTAVTGGPAGQLTPLPARLRHPPHTSTPRVQRRPPGRVILDRKSPP